MQRFQMAALRAGSAALLFFAAQDSPGQSALTPAAGAKAYDLVFSTYLGGSNGDLLRDMTVDAEGNIFVAGIAGSADFPRTPGALPGQAKAGGGMVAKFSPTGRLLWSRVIGAQGESSYLYSVKVDRAGYVFAAGRMAPGFPTTPETPPAHDQPPLRLHRQAEARRLRLGLGHLCRHGLRRPRHDDG